MGVLMLRSVTFATLLAGFLAAGSYGLAGEAIAQVQIEPVAVTDQVAPGTGDALFRDFRGPVINSAGQTIFAGFLSASSGDPAVIAPVDGGLWADDWGSLIMMAREGDILPGDSAALDEYFATVLKTSSPDSFIGETSSDEPTDDPSGAPAIDDTNDTGLWSEGSGSLALVAREGDAAPGTGGVVFDLFIASVINSAGEAAFMANLRTGATGPVIDGSNDRGLWSNGSGSLALVAREGDAAPGTGDALFDFLNFVPLIDPLGKMTFLGQLRAGSGSPAVDGSNDLGIWSERSGSLALVLREGDTAPGTGNARFDRLSFLKTNGAGKMAFMGNLRPGTGSPVVDSSNDKGLWSEDSGSLALLVREGDTAPGTGGATFNEFGIPALNTVGKTAFVGFLNIGSGSPAVEISNELGIWSNHSGSLALVVREGDIMPGTGNARLLRFNNSFVINAAGDIAFPGLLSFGTGSPAVDGSNNKGVWLKNGNGLTLIARKGDIAPGTNNALFELFGTPVINDAGETAFLGFLRPGTGSPAVDGSNDKGFWIADPSGVLRLVVREGDPLDVAPGDTRIISSLSAFVSNSAFSVGQDGNVTSVNNGRLSFNASFTDGTSGIFVAFIDNEAPVADAGGPYIVDEGGTVVLDASASSDADGDTHTFTWDLDGDDVFETPGVSPVFSAMGLDGPGTMTVKVRVSDGKSGVAIASAVVNIGNVAPVITTMTAPSDPQPIGTSVLVEASFTDAGTPDTHSALFDWGDGITTAGTVTQGSGSGSVQGSHSYTVPGVYTVTLTVTDDDGGSHSSIFESVMVFDPNSGFVKGNGTIDSPAGAYADDPALTGRARFTFNSKYNPDDQAFIGNTKFQLNIGDLRFASDTIQLLTVSGARAQLTGTGTIKKRAGSFGFMVIAIDGEIDGGIDKFRIRIWDAGNTSIVIYDNGLGAPDDADLSTGIRKGSITIQNKNGV